MPTFAEQFSNDCQKILYQRHYSDLANARNLFKAREKSRVAVIFASHWLKNWREIFKPIAIA